MTSIIIPTCNAGKKISRLCDSLRGQSESAEIIVVDSSSSDGTPEIAKSFGAKVLVVRKEEFDHGGTRTLAGTAAEGDILVFMTQDALPYGSDSVANLIRPFEDSKVGAVFGRQIPHPDSSPFAAHLRSFNYPETSFVRQLSDREKFGIKTPFLSNSFAAYRKQALREIGGFKERLILGEDTYAGARLLLAGYKIAYAADAVVYHSHNYTAFDEFRRYFDIGVFHTQEDWILHEFGKAGGEGIRYVKSGVEYLKKNGMLFLLPEFFFRGILKYAGYTLGRHSGAIPLSLNKKMSMHNNWWDSVR